MSDNLPMMTAEGGEGALALHGGDGVANALQSFMAGLNRNSEHWDGLEVSVHHSTKPSGESTSVLSYRAYKHQRR
jgi:hypothetical protein